MITLAMLTKHWPNAIAGLNEAVADAADDTFTLYNLTTPLRIAHFMAQISHECGAGTVVEENLNYSAARAYAVWPSRFTSEADAAQYAHKPQQLADHVYNGRMGNRLGTSDGWDYRGRGLIQITGRDEYKAIGDIVGWDLGDNPDRATDLVNLLPIACADLRTYPNIFTYMDADDCRAVTRAINGGFSGLPEREGWLKVWKTEVGL